MNNRLQCIKLQALAILLFMLSDIVVAAKIEKIDKTIPLIDIKSIEVINHRGKISFEGKETDSLTITGSLDEQAIALNISQQQNRLVLDVQVPEHLAPKKGSNLKITLPGSIAIQVKGISSQWRFKHTFAVQIETVGGDIRLADVLGDVTIDAVSADIDIQNVQGNLIIDSLSGKITLTEIAGLVEVSSVEGNIQFLQKMINQAFLSNVKGSISVKGQLSAGAWLNVDSVDGNILLNLGQSDSFRSIINVLEDGEIINQLSEKGQKSTDEKGQHLNVIVGDGLAQIIATTVSGKVKLMK